MRQEIPRKINDHIKERRKREREREREREKREKREKENKWDGPKEDDDRPPTPKTYVTWLQCGSRGANVRRKRRPVFPSCYFYLSSFFFVSVSIW